MLLISNSSSLPSANFILRFAGLPSGRICTTTPAVTLNYRTGTKAPHQPTDMHTSKSILHSGFVFFKRGLDNRCTRYSPAQGLSTANLRKMELSAFSEAMIRMVEQQISTQWDHHPVYMSMPVLHFRGCLRIRPVQYGCLDIAIAAILRQPWIHN